jgi:hypothetical protein
MCLLPVRDAAFAPMQDSLDDTAFLQARTVVSALRPRASSSVRNSNYSFFPYSTLEQSLNFYPRTRRTRNRTLPLERRRTHSAHQNRDR